MREGATEATGAIEEVRVAAGREDDDGCVRAGSTEFPDTRDELSSTSLGVGVA